MIEAMAISAVPLILAAMGGLLSERAGVLNIALEGCIASGAFFAALVLYHGGSPLSAVLAAAASGVLFGALLSAAHLSLGANLFIAGLGVNLLIPSLTGLISQLALGHRGTIRVPEGFDGAFGESALIITAAMMLPLAAASVMLLSRTGFGVRIRAAGSSPEFLKERAVSPHRVQFSTLLISSASASLAGAFLSIRVEAFVPGMSAGRGWIALVVIWLGFRHPAGILLASYFFSLIEIISGKAQGIPGVPATLLLALPYLAALAALTAAAVGRKARLLKSDGLIP